MAKKTELTINEVSIIEVDEDPTISGVDAPIGSIALLSNGVNGRLWSKTGPLSSDWTVIAISDIEIGSHASRHLPNGADPLATGVPSTIGTSNSEGTANAFARQDHIHDHGSQTNPNHHAVATTTANGFMSASDKQKLDSIILGTYFSYSESLGLSTVGSNTFTNKVTLNTGNVPAGTYRVGWSYEWYLTDTTNDFRARVLVDGSTQLLAHRQEPHDSSSNQRHIASGFGYITFTNNASHTITLDYCRNAGTGTAGIANARLEFWRVS